MYIRVDIYIYFMPSAVREANTSRNNRIPIESPASLNTIGNIFPRWLKELHFETLKKFVCL